MLSAAFSDEELTTLAFDHFRPLYDDFSGGMGKGRKIQELIAYCDREVATDRLLALVRQKRPAQYRRFLGDG